MHINRIALQVLPLSQYVRTMLVTMYAYFALYWVPSLSFLCGALTFSNLVQTDSYQITYLQFHFIWLLPLIFVMLYAIRNAFYPNATRLDWYAKHAFAGTVALVLMACIYTTPWDNFLVWRHVWGYSKRNEGFGSSVTVWSYMAYVPMEEYAYFILETILICVF